MTAAEHYELDATGEDLPAGTTLSNDHFAITGSLGAGGFGKTYTAHDNVLGRRVVIKECFPEDFCMRHANGKTVVPRHLRHATHVRSIVRMFMSEARSIAQLRHPSIVGVHSAFEENQTAYMVLDLLDGPDLLEILDNGSDPIPPLRVEEILTQLLDAIERVHAVDLLHRDISPDNIIIEKSGAPVLIDFGAVRADASRRTRAMTSMLVVKDGYSPQEFYVPGTPQTPSSDLYALGATFYHLVSGEAPVDSQTRMMAAAARKPDPCPALEGRVSGYDPVFLRAIDRAMQIFPAERLQSAAEWREMIRSRPPEGSIARPQHEEASSSDAAFLNDITRGAVSTASSGANGDRLRISLGLLVERTNAEVRKSRSLEPKPEPVTPLKSEKSHAPEWVEEFNQQTLESIETVAEADDASDVIEVRSDPDQDEGQERFPEDDSLVRATAGGEIDWIERACEKQARLRTEREQALSASARRAKSQRGGRITVSGDAGDDAGDRAMPRSAVGTFRWYLSAVFVATMISLFGAYLQVI